MQRKQLESQRVVNALSRSLASCEQSYYELRVLSWFHYLTT